MAWKALKIVGLVLVGLIVGAGAAVAWWVATYEEDPPPKTYATTVFVENAGSTTFAIDFSLKDARQSTRVSDHLTLAPGATKESLRVFLLPEGHALTATARAATGNSQSQASASQTFQLNGCAKTQQLVVHVEGQGTPRLSLSVRCLAR